jgi:hypothetical protein
MGAFFLGERIMRQDAFEPIIGQAVGITIAAASARVALPTMSRQFRLHNNTTETIYFKVGDSTVTATASMTGNMSIGAGVHEVLTLTRGDGVTTHIAAIGSGATGTFGVVPGEGL